LPGHNRRYDSSFDEQTGRVVTAVIINLLQHDTESAGHDVKHTSCCIVGAGWACAADPERPEVWYISVSPMFVDGKPGLPAARVDGKANAYIFRSVGGAQ
jgi:hypothetical protein